MRLFLSFGLLLVFLSLITPAWAGQANMFVYHRFGDARYPSTNIALEVFAKQLELLRTKEYTVLPLGDVVDRLTQGTPLPERCAVLTDTAWLRTASEVEGALIPGLQVRAFRSDQELEAEDWLTEA